MKKILSVFLIIVVLFTVCGCNNKKDIVNDEKNNYINAKFDKKLVLRNIAEITFNKIEIVEEILPPDTSGSVYKYNDNANEKYIVLEGTFKNLMSDKFRGLNNFDGVLKVNNKYEYKSVVIVFANDDDNTFYNEPDSLETMNCYIWVSVPDEIINDNSNTFDFYLDFFDDNNKKSINFNFKLDDLAKECYENSSSIWCVAETFDVHYDLINKNILPDNIYVKNVDLTYKEVLLRGTEEELDKVAFVKAVIDLNEVYPFEAGTYDLENIPVYAYDKNGNKLNTLMIVPQTISATLELGK